MRQRDVAWASGASLSSANTQPWKKLVSSVRASAQSCDSRCWSFGCRVRWSSCRPRRLRGKLQAGPSTSAGSRPLAAPAVGCSRGGPRCCRTAKLVVRIDIEPGIGVIAAETGYRRPRIRRSALGRENPRGRHTRSGGDSTPRRCRPAWDGRAASLADRSDQRRTRAAPHRSRRGTSQLRRTATHPLSCHVPPASDGIAHPRHTSQLVGSSGRSRPPTRCSARTLPAKHPPTTGRVSHLFQAAGFPLMGRSPSSAVSAPQQ